MTAPAQPPDEGFSEKEHASEMNVAEVHGSIVRERADPRAGREPVPLWLLAIFFSIIFWAGLYLAYNSGGFRADVFDPARVAGGSAAQTGPVDPKVLGRRVFTQNCMVCHQTTGLGVPRQFPPLAGSEWVLGQDWHGDNHLVKIVLKGLQGPIQVKGNTFNNAMPTWSMLTDEQIADVLTYIRSEWGNAAPPIPADFVRAMREQTAARTEPWSPKDLQAIPAEKAPAATVPPGPSPVPSAAAITSQTFNCRVVEAHLSRSAGFQPALSGIPAGEIEANQEKTVRQDAKRSRQDARAPVCQPEWRGLFYRIF